MSLEEIRRRSKELDEDPSIGCSWQEIQQALGRAEIPPVHLKPLDVLLKNPTRAKAIAVQLLKDYGNADDESRDQALQALSGEIQAVAYGLSMGVKRIFKNHP